MSSLSKNSRPTIHDVAAALGMHKSTVSYGLSGKGTIKAATRERILKVAREMGYEPSLVAQRLSGSLDNNLVYLCAGGLDLGLATAKVLYIQQKLREFGLEVPIYSVAQVGEAAKQSQAEAVRELCRQQPRAIAFSAHGCESSVLTELERYQHNGGVVVSYDLPISLACDQVVFDREHNTYQATHYLIERGHRKLGINYPPLALSASDAGVRRNNPRVAGFYRALEEAGLQLNPDWIFDSVRYEQGGVEMAESFLAMKERPTGLCVINDYTALAFMSEVMAAGVKIPDDVSVISHDNQLVARFCPVPLTSAVHPVEAIAQAVVDLLVARLEGNRDEVQTVTIRGDIVERKSVAVVVS